MDEELSAAIGHEFPRSIGDDTVGDGRFREYLYQHTVSRERRFFDESSDGVH